MLAVAVRVSNAGIAINNFLKYWEMGDKRTGASESLDFA